jgi:hypothetical protein
VKLIPHLIPDEAEEAESEWYCIKTDPYVCTGCKRICEFLHLKIKWGNRIIVWPEKDDDILLTAAADWKRKGRNPRIVLYQPEFGTCVSVHEINRMIQEDDY